MFGERKLASLLSIRPLIRSTLHREFKIACGMPLHRLEDSDGVGSRAVDDRASCKDRPGGRAGGVSPLRDVRPRIFGVIRVILGCERERAGGTHSGGSQESATVHNAFE